MATLLVIPRCLKFGLYVLRQFLKKFKYVICILDFHFRSIAVSVIWIAYMSGSKAGDRDADWEIAYHSSGDKEILTHMVISKNQEEEIYLRNI